MNHSAKLRSLSKNYSSIAVCMLQTIKPGVRQRSKQLSYEILRRISRLSIEELNKCVIYNECCFYSTGGSTTLPYANTKFAHGFVCHGFSCDYLSILNQVGGDIWSTYVRPSGSHLPFAYAVRWSGIPRESRHGLTYFPVLIWQGNAIRGWYG